MAALCLALYPAAAKGLGGIGAEGVHALGTVAMAILTVKGELRWQERLSASGSRHPEFVRFAQVVDALKGPRQARARQLFLHFLAAGVVPADPAGLEAEFHGAVQAVTSSLHPAKG